MTHAPKHAMLIALGRGRLSAAGRRRAQAHLARCEVCRHALAGHDLLAAATADARALDVPTVDYDRMALTLRREGHARALRESRRMLYGALTIAATVALAALGASRLANRARTGDAHAETPARATAPNSVPAAGTRSTTAGRSSSPGDTQTAPAALAGGELAEGMWLRSETGELRVALWTDTDVVLRQGSLVRVVTLRGHQAQLKLERGAITSEVARLQSDESFEIAVSDLVVAVRGTRFVVERGEDGRAHVTLSEGVVVVMRGEQQVARLLAPAEWIDETAGMIAVAPAAHDALAPMDEGTVSEHAPTARTRSKSDVPNRRVDATPTAVSHLFARAAPLLRKCHSESLRADPATPTSVVLAVTVSDSGHPLSVDVHTRGGVVPQILADCIRGHVVTWHFPLEATAGARLEIPLNFTVPR